MIFFACLKMRLILKCKHPNVKIAMEKEIDVFFTFVKRSC